MKRSIIVLSLLTAFIYSCQSNGKSTALNEESPVPKWKEPKTLAYEFRNTKQWLQDSTVQPSERAIAIAINRTDSLHFIKMDSVIVPVDLSGDLVYYLPFPLHVPYLKEIDKIIFFSYATQTFAAYEHGELIRTGPTNMGSEKHVTPTGFFHTNWKAKKTISTVNAEWILKWNFNILNKGGVGWHQYSMPGYPASHSCLRLQENDAKYLFDWADKWVLEDKATVLVKGTPVIVFGNYDFHSPKPWLKLVSYPHALDISENEIKNTTEPFLQEILSEQEGRRAFESEN